MLVSEFTKYAKSFNLWKLLFDVVLEGNRSLHLALYEDVKENPVKEIRKILKFLEMTNGYKPDNLEERLLCLSENLRGGFKRKHPEKQNPYTNELKQIMNLRIDQAQETLNKHKMFVNITHYKKDVSNR